MKNFEKWISLNTPAESRKSVTLFYLLNVARGIKRIKQMWWKFQFPLIHQKI